MHGKHAEGRQMRKPDRRFSSILIVLGAGVIVLAGMRAASGIIAPFLVAVLIATMAAPLVFWLHRRGVPKVLSVLIVIGAIVGILSLVGGIALTSLKDFNETLPEYQAQLELRIGDITANITALGRRFGISFRAADIWNMLNLGSAARMASVAVLEAGNFLTKALLVVFMTLFLLFEGFRLPAKLEQAIGYSEQTWSGFRTYVQSVQKYLVVKTASSLATGIVAGTWLWILGVDHAVFWGVVTFLFNYVPNIGSFAAAVPPMLMAVVQYGLGVCLLVAAGYVVINVVIGGLIEPNFMGSSVGLAPLVVFMSLVFWGWVLGAAGMLLSTPLTISLKIALENFSDTNWIADILGSGKS